VTNVPLWGAKRAELRLLLNCPSQAANAEHSKLSETNWNLLTRIGFHLNPLTPDLGLGVSRYQKSGRNQIGFPRRQRSHLPSFDLSYCLGDVVFFPGTGLMALLMCWGRKLAHGHGSDFIAKVLKIQYIILTIRSERSPQGKRATADSGLSSGGGGWGTQL